MITTTINCPHCRKGIAFEQVFSLPVREELRAMFAPAAAELNRLRAELASREAKLRSQNDHLGFLQGALDRSESEMQRLMVAERELRSDEAKASADLANDAKMRDIRQQIAESTKGLNSEQEVVLQLRKEYEELEAARQAFDLETCRKLVEERRNRHEDAH
jgi:chromosome segregation ATPase